MGLNQRELDAFYSVFAAVDIDGSNAVSTGEFYAYFGMDHSMYNSRIFELFDVDKSGEVDFEEFVCASWNFCSYDVTGMTRFSFKLFDLNDSGFLDKDELTLLLDDIYGDDADGRARSKQVWASLANHLAKGTTRAGEMSLPEFEDFIAVQPKLIEPALRIQELLRRRVLGPEHWVRVTEKRPHTMKHIKRMHAEHYAELLDQATSGASAGDNVRAQQIYRKRMAEAKAKVKEKRDKAPITLLINSDYTAGSATDPEAAKRDAKKEARRAQIVAQQARYASEVAVNRDGGVQRAIAGHFDDDRGGEEEEETKSQKTKQQRTKDADLEIAAALSRVEKSRKRMQLNSDNAATQTGGGFRSLKFDHTTMESPTNQGHGPPGTPGTPVLPGTPGTPGHRAVFKKRSVEIIKAERQQRMERLHSHVNEKSLELIHGEEGFFGIDSDFVMSPGGGLCDVGMKNPGQRDPAADRRRSTIDVQPLSPNTPGTPMSGGGKSRRRSTYDVDGKAGSKYRSKSGRSSSSSSSSKSGQSKKGGRSRSDKSKRPSNIVTSAETEAVAGGMTNAKGSPGSPLSPIRMWGSTMKNVNAIGAKKQ